MRILSADLVLLNTILDIQRKGKHPIAAEISRGSFPAITGQPAEDNIIFLLFLVRSDGIVKV